MRGFRVAVRKSGAAVDREPSPVSEVIGRHRRFAMQTFVGMILGALLLGVGVYIHDSMQTSSVANGEAAQSNRPIVNWDVAKADWDALKVRAHNDWVRISSK
jgi:hypothetical protein